jgi:hypothetical protein
MIENKHRASGPGLLLVMALSIGGSWSSNAMAAPQVPNASELFDWAQTAFPAFFPGIQPTVVGPGFSFRGPYSTGNYVGVEGSTIYVLGPSTSNQLFSAGSLADFACSVHPNSCTATALEDARAYLARVDAMYATGLPTTGAAWASLADTCSMTNGYSNAADQARFDNDPEVREVTARRIGSKRRNVSVLAERRTTNTDGSARREIDVRYDIEHTDGVTQTGVTETLIQGSSAGTLIAGTPCATPQNSQTVRAFGNQRLVAVSVSSVSVVFDRYKLADGTPLSPARTYRSEIRFNISDPANRITYATISGPGVRGTYKLVAPRLLRSSPEFSGKPGNFVNLPDDETFKICRPVSGTSYPDASAADCIANGAVGNNWQATGTDPAIVDRDFATFGFVAGGTYTISVYNDDGWKTVNGQASSRPLATYETKLQNLPASAAELSAGTAAAYPEVSLSLTPIQLASLVREKAAGNLQATPSRAAKSSAPLRWDAVYLFEQGRTGSSTANNFYPAWRANLGAVVPLSAQSQNLTLPVPPQVLVTPTYAEVGIIYTDLNGGSIRRIFTFE